MISKSAVLDAWHNTIWTEGQVDRIPDFLAQGFAAKGILASAPLHSPDFPELVQALRSRVGPIKVTLPHTIETGDWLAALIRIRSSDAVTGKPLDFQGQVMIEFQGDKFLNFFSNFDFMALFEELGQLPPQTFPLLLAGTRLG